MKSKKITHAGLAKLPDGKIVESLTTRGNTNTYTKTYASTAWFKVGNESVLFGETGKGGSYRNVIHKMTSYGSPMLRDGRPQTASYTSGFYQTDKKVTGLTTYALSQMPAVDSFAGAFDGRSFTNIDWSALSSAAYNAMRPTMATDNSLINFLYELKDFKLAAQSIVNRFKGTGTTASIFATLIGYTNRKTVGKSSRALKRVTKSKKLSLGSAYTAAGVHLNYKFGLAPFVRDVLNLYSSLSNFNKRFAELKRRAKTPQQRKYRCYVQGTSLPELELFNRVYGIPGGYHGSYDAAVRGRIKRLADNGIRYSANMRFVYELPPEVNSVHGRLKAILDSLGVRPNLKIIWDMIPYTFLLDWISSVGDILGQLQLDNLAVKVRISEFCHSAKAEVRDALTVQQNVWNNGLINWGPETTIQTVVRSVYIRIVDNPGYGGSVNWKGPTFGQGGLALSLFLRKVL